MKVLVVGGGGREHALAWRVAQSDSVERVFVAPGNPGTAAEDKIENVDLGVDDFDALAAFAGDNGIDLTIVGPEAPLVAGIRDLFDARGLACFGPTKAAAALEGSKVFTKNFLARHDIPTAAYETFTESDAAVAYIRSCGAPIVIKADGLAAGKAVVVAHSVDDAVQAAREMLSGESFGDAGRQVVVEEFLDGEEASFICLCDGTRALSFASSQDHKPVDEGDKGPNTGGMGAYSPAPVVTDAVHRRIMSEVIEPTLRGMAEEGAPYQGFLYAGLMVMPDGAVKVIEFNCRFGDPEAQPVLSRLKTDLASVCRDCLEAGVDGLELEWDERVAVGVVMAAGGYPIRYETGDVISGLDDHIANTKVFHAGTTMVDGELVTHGGRVLCVVGLGGSVSEAQALAYQRVDRISWRNAYCRRDIGYRAIAREQG
ncbi:MAG: phosphoribosylamine--glycine ligase [Gammaproteobacteria bacterium]|nr:phosphoribosylamine--glycine ligase [Gammaproteobacteria bacterium]